MFLLKKIPGNFYAVCTLLVLIITTSLGFIPLLFIGLFKLVPNQKWQTKCTLAIDALVTWWCAFNNYFINRVQRAKWDIRGLDSLDKKDWYLVVANHQSWLDVLALQRVFNRKIPILKFFVKAQLKWIPLLGFSWWAMGCPFMKRYSKEYLAKNPHKKGQDLIATAKAIATFKKTPASIMNFIEGTRFAQNKKEQQNSPYKHLLKPKAGGISFIISSMGKQITSLLDVTIVYPGKNHSLWDFLCKRIPLITVHVKQIPIPAQFISADFSADHQKQNEFKNWLNQQWAEKDQLISALK